MASPSVEQPAKRTVLITGATGGIGRATALAFAKTGAYHLALHYKAASPETRKAIESQLQSHTEGANVTISWFHADLSFFNAVQSLHHDVEQQFGGVDVLFNNAGTTQGVSGVGSLADVSMEVMEKTWRINAGSPMLLTQLCLPRMEEKGWGRVVFNSSVAAFTGGLIGPHYASSKSALHGFIHWLAGKVAKKGITVNGIAPAVIEDTAMLPGGSAEISSKVPVGRLGRPEEIAETVMWMVNTAYVTNKVITVDGGMYPY